MSGNVTAPIAQLPPVVIHIDLKPTLGVDFVGVVLASILYGITTLQTIYYYRTYSSDRLRLKVLVASLWALDTLSLLLVAHGVYTYLVVDFDDILAVTGLVWSINSEPAVTSVIALTVNIFLIYRIYTLRKKWWPVAVLLFTWSLAPFALGIVAVWRTNSGIQSLDAVSELHWIAIAADSLSSSLDLTIAALLCYLLWQGRSPFMSTNLNQVIQVLTVYVIMSGLTTATLNLLTLITYLASPTTLLFQMFNMCVSKAYVNTLMATLNARDTIRGSVSRTAVVGLSWNSATANGGGSNLPAINFRAASRSQAEDGDEYGLNMQKMSADSNVIGAYSGTLASEDHSQKMNPSFVDAV